MPVADLLPKSVRKLYETYRENQDFIYLNFFPLEDSGIHFSFVYLFLFYFIFFFFFIIIIFFFAKFI